HAHQSVRHLLVAIEPLCVSDKDAAVIEINLGNVLENNLCKLFVDRLTRGEICRHARLIEQLVDLGIAIAHRILWGVTFEEDRSCRQGRCVRSTPKDTLGNYLALPA